MWLKYLLPVTLKGGSTEPLELPLATGMVKYIGETGDFLDPPRIMTIMKKKMMLHAMMGNREEDTARQLPHQLVTQAQPVLH